MLIFSYVRLTWAQSAEWQEIQKAIGKIQPYLEQPSPSADSAKAIGAKIAELKKLASS